MKESTADYLTAEDVEIDSIVKEMIRLTPINFSPDDQIILEMKEDPKVRALGKIYQEKRLNLEPVIIKDGAESFKDLLIYFKNTYASQTELVKKLEALIRERGISPRLIYWQIEINNTMIAELMVASGLT
ncbi:MAG: hypothetical protein ACOX0C_01900 [Patescibacteria group bacterium]|jgi:hypothetical protein